MNVYAISDLHLPGGEKKPMDVFGAHWENHFDRIQADWHTRVQPEDVVLIPGDISWAIHLPDAQHDLDTIGMLPGKKVLLRGNHDYWWSSISRVRSALPRHMYALQNDALQFGDLILCGSRGWLCPGATNSNKEDECIYRRELLRLKMSLDDAKKKSAIQTDPWLVAMLHYPPFTDKNQDTEVSQMLAQYSVRDVVYGHLHGAVVGHAFSGEKAGVRYHLASCDKLNFTLYKLER